MPTGIQLYEDAGIQLLHMAMANHAVALDTGLMAVPFSALHMLCRWSPLTLHQLLKRLIRERYALIDIQGPDKRNWRYTLTHKGHTRALAIYRQGLRPKQPPIHDQQPPLQLVPGVTRAVAQ